jgi:LuxR family maltose regulon positive regulatory protein
MGTPLLITKLRTPPVRPELVPRPRLIERLNAELELDNRFVRKLTLVCAPAGYGKTTLISAWLTGQHRAYSWLSLEEGDNDPARFMAYLLAALRTVDARMGQAAEAALRGPQPPSSETLLTVLLNDIAARPDPFLLVLDDYHCIQTLSIHQQLAFLLEHQPPQMHLVIATREELPLPLSRLRARGQVADIRQADLSFTPEEASDFLLRTMHLRLSPTDAAALHQRTEGWIAGLQLAALSLQASDDVQQSVQSFAGSHRYILDYLMDEVFERQTPGVGDFMLRTCILERFNAPLCDALVERQDSDRVLRTLEDANLFIVPLDESRQWYRYHQLFADLLRHRLDLEKQYDLALLHRRASEWFADNGFATDAVHHALAAADWPRATALISPLAGNLLKQGQTATLLRWFRTLPENAVCADLQLCLNFAWALILTEQFGAAGPYLARAEQAAVQSGARFVLGQVAVAKAYIARARGDHDQVIALSEQALELVPPDEGTARSVLLVNLGMAQFYRGHLGKAAEAFSAAEQAGRTSGNEYARWTAAIFLNRIRIAQGKLRQAAEAGREIVQQGGHLPIVALAYYDLSRLHLEWNDLAAAADCVAQGIELSRRGGGVEFTGAGYLVSALIRVAQHDVPAAQAALREAERLLEHPDISPSTRLYSLACHIWVALAQDDLKAATLAGERSPTFENAGSVGDYLFLMLAQAQLALAQGRRVLAAERLAALRATALQKGFRNVATQACVLQALAAPNRAEGLAFLSEALAEAEPEGYVRTLVSPGESMAVLLRAAAARGSASPYVRHLLAALAISAPEPRLAAAPALIEPLSDRELQVLCLLAEGQTNQEIAHRLYMSVNTVKTHLKNIYGKLGAKNRAKAGARARELGLIP